MRDDADWVKFLLAEQQRVQAEAEKQSDPLKPRGKPLVLWKGTVPITDDDIDAAIAEWDQDVPEAAGLLEAASA